MRADATDPVVTARVVALINRLHIDGMHCKNCERRITDAVNAIEGLTCRVSLEKNEAVVSYETEPMLEDVIKKLGEMDFLAVAID